jgi:DNA polymerase-3 subunit delta'
MQLALPTIAVHELPWLQPKRSQLWQLATQSHLHHALLFTGPLGIGKSLLAAELAAFLLCHAPDTQRGACGKCKSCVLRQAGNHPDLMQLTDTSQSIGVDAVRDISYFLQNAAQQGGARVVLIAAAERFTEAAANALLKTLEEPGDNSFLVLQTTAPALLLPTILSRCQRWDIAPYYGTQLLDWLGLHFSAEIPAMLPHLAGGGPLYALALLQQGHAAVYAELNRQLDAFIRLELDVWPLVSALEQAADIHVLLQWWVNQQLLQGHCQASERFLQRFSQWNRDEHFILGQNKTLALASLLLDLRSLLQGGRR